MKLYRPIAHSLICGVALGLLCCTAARAQERATFARTSTDTPADASPPDTTTKSKAANAYAGDTSDSTWHIYSVSYTWLPGANGSAGLLGYNASLHISAWDIVQKARFAIVGALVPSYNRFSLPTDFVWLRLKDNKAVPFNPAYSIQAKATASIFTPKAAVLVVDSPKVRVFGTAGIRYWHLGSTFTLSPPLLSGNGLYRSANWVDFVVGGRFTVPLSQKGSIDILGDAGAGGANLDYQVAGTVNYQVKPKLILMAGFRYLTIHYQGNAHQFLYNTSMPGIVLGATYRYR